MMFHLCCARLSGKNGQAMFPPSWKFKGTSASRNFLGVRGGLLLSRGSSFSRSSFSRGSSFSRVFGLRFLDTQLQMRVHVLIQTDITFKILKTYMGFCIFLQMKNGTFRLYKLETSSRCQICKISFNSKSRQFSAFGRYRLAVFIIWSISPFQIN